MYFANSNNKTDYIFSSIRFEFGWLLKDVIQYSNFEKHERESETHASSSVAWARGQWRRCTAHTSLTQSMWRLCSRSPTCMCTRSQVSSSWEASRSATGWWAFHSGRRSRTVPAPAHSSLESLEHSVQFNTVRNKRTVVLVNSFTLLYCTAVHVLNSLKHEAGCTLRKSTVQLDSYRNFKWKLSRYTVYVILLYILANDITKKTRSRSSSCAIFRLHIFNTWEFKVYFY